MVKIYSIGEYAKIKKVSRASVHNWIKAKKVTAKKCGDIWVIIKQSEKHMTIREAEELIRLLRELQRTGYSSDTALERAQDIATDYISELYQTIGE